MISFDLNHLTMSRRLSNNADFLRVLAKAKPNLRRAILKCCHSELIKVICEVTLNVLHGVVPLNSQQERKLKRYKKILRALADRSLSLKKKKEHLNQTGGSFLPALLPPVLSALASLLSK